MIFRNVEGTITYERFVDDVANRVAELLINMREEPEYVSQRKAFCIFGRRNVERWRNSGIVTAIRQPGKLLYNMADLRRLQRNEQDYLIR